MEKNKFQDIKIGVQEIIDFIAVKNAKEANNRLVAVSEDLDEILDFSDEDDDLREVSRYQVLLNQLQQRIIALNGQSSTTL